MSLLHRVAFTPPTPPLTTVPGTVLFLPATSPATILSDASGTGANVTGGGGEAYSSDFPGGVSCGAAPSTATTASSTGAGSRGDTFVAPVRELTCLLACPRLDRSVVLRLRDVHCHKYYDGYQHCNLLVHIFEHSVGNRLLLVHKHRD